MDREDILIVFSIFSLFVVSFSLGVLISITSDEMVKIGVKDVDAPEECSNMTLIDTSYCLNRYVNNIYKYEIRDDFERPTLEELIEEGGDCLNWAELYVKYAEQLGYRGKRVIFNLDDENAHAIAILSGPDSYCLLDQTLIECYEFDKDYEETN